MFKMEKNFLDCIERNLIRITVIIGTILSVLIRVAFKDIVSGDYKAFLEGWYDQIYSGGGDKAAGRQNRKLNFL